MIKPETSDFFGNELDKAKLEIASYWKDKYEKTRKALDVAKNAINSAVDHNIINCVARGIDPRTDDTNVTLCKALEQITAEQKDVK